jgi:DNA-binding transcriptional LysR family regulator
MSRRLPRLPIEGLKVLDAIDRHGSFAAAAQALFVVTSSVTHTVRNLEESLGINLFDRSGRRARFTREGRMLLERGRELLAQAAAFDAEVQRIATGWEPRLVLSVDQIIRMDPLLPLVAAFCKAAPQTSLQLQREAAAGSWDALLSGRADLVVGAPAEGPAGGGYESAPLYRNKFVLAVAPGHPLARIYGPIADAELARHRAVFLGDTTRGLPHLQYGLQKNRNVLSVPDTDTKLQALLLGTGCGFLPERLAQPHVRAGRLVLLKVATPQPPSQSTLAWRAGENGRALKWWIEQLTRPKLAERLFF